MSRKQPDRSQGELWENLQHTANPPKQSPAPKSPKSKKTRRVSGWKRFRRLLWSWPVVGATAVALYSVGVNATYGHDWIIASVLYFLAVLLAAIKFITWEETKNFKYKGATTVVALLFAVFLFGASLKWAYDKREHAPKTRSHLHIVGVTRSAVAIGQQLFVNVIFMNDGQLPMKLQSYYLIKVEDSRPDMELYTRQEELFSQLLGDIKAGRTGSPPVEIELPPNATRFMSDVVGMPIVKAHISSDELPKLQSGELSVYYMGRILYSDSNGSHITDYCGTIQRDPYIIIACRKHNSEE